MKRTLQQLSVLLIASFTALTSFAQNQQGIKPVILGDSILCPNSSSVLHTQKIYDAYQWYERDYFSDEKVLIKGATTNEIVVNTDDELKYFSVEVKLKGVKSTSDEKLIDGLVFIPPSVKSSGDFKNGPGFFALNAGDTGIFTLLRPYNTNITWYKNGQPITGEASTKLYVTSAGTYTVQGAPDECPNYIQPLGVDLVVKVRIPKPTITGDTLLCPDSKSTLQTQAGYDSYQWYKRWYGTNKKKPVEDATTNTLTVSSSRDASAYFSVEVTKKNDTLDSKEVFVDAYVFASPTVLSGGDFINGAGYFMLNKGDTGTFTLMQPYDTNITWSKNGKAITGETNVTLNVTTGGNYTVQGAPSVCPNFIQNPGVILQVQLIRDSSLSKTNASGAQAQNLSSAIKLYPNPAKNYALLNVGAFAGKDISVNISSQDGKIVFAKQYTSADQSIKVDLTNIKPGAYYVKVSDKLNQQSAKLVISQ